MTGIPNKKFVSEILVSPLDGLMLWHGKFTPLHLQKILQHMLPVLGEDRLGVELDAVDGEVTVGEAHDFAFGGFGGDFQAGREGFAFDDEGVVAGGFEGARQAGEDILASVQNRRGFAMHESRGTDDIASVNLADALVAKADSKNGDFSAEMPNHIATDARLGG